MSFEIDGIRIFSGQEFSTSESEKRSKSSNLLALPARQLAVKQAPCEARDVAPRRGGRAGHDERRESERGSVSDAADENVVDVDRNSAPSKEIDERKGKLQLQLELRQRPAEHEE